MSKDKSLRDQLDELIVLMASVILIQIIHWFVRSPQIRHKIRTRITGLLLDMGYDLK